MIFSRFLLIVLLVLANSDVYAVIKCASLFTSNETPDISSPRDYGRLGLAFTTFQGKYADTSLLRTGVGGISSASGVMSRKIYLFNDWKSSTTITSFQSEPERGSRDPSYRAFVQENIDFVISNYAQRRTWSPELREQLRNEAFRYAEQSTYVEYRTREISHGLRSDSHGLLRGTIKFIRVDGRNGEKELPMENDFQIVIPPNGGRKFEIGNFAMLKDHLETARVEIYTQLVLHARDEILIAGHEPGKMLYFTPVDAIGKKMYSKMGFELVAGFNSPLVENGTNWWMMGATAETLASLPDRIAQNRNLWPEEDSAYLDALTTRFQKLSGLRVQSEGFRTSNLSDRNHHPEKEAHVFLSEPFTEEGKSYRVLEIHASPGSPAGIEVKIPLSAFPLREGWFYKQNKFAVMGYRNGKFIVRHMARNGKMDEEDHYWQSASVTTDPEFKNVRRIQVFDKWKKFSADF